MEAVFIITCSFSVSKAVMFWNCKLSQTNNYFRTQNRNKRHYSHVIYDFVVPYLPFFMSPFFAATFLLK